ncbi:hypothetical protein [Actinokineospora iranica]|uniref:hypothetical protein n=1 Tax=Actinokineospora iranica TaxID=1271860 RepID=UPI001113BB66|nr:hypothetical protein [Actinokineospora iranica]
MMEPSGPLPKGVYLRRRILAVAGTAFGVVVLIWLIDGLIGDQHDLPPGAAAVADSGPTSSPPSTSSSPPTASTTSDSPPAATSTETSTTPPPPPPPDPSEPCPDASVAVTAELGAPTYRVGQKPVLRLVVANTGPHPCTRDIGRAQRELVVTGPDGATRLWSSNDCYAAKGEHWHVLAPGERHDFDLTWAGRTSAPGCPPTRTAVPPGDYLVTAKLGPLAGPGVPITITP